MNDVTRILSRIEAGDRAAADELLPLVYDELRRLARARLGHEQPGQTLQPTALVHEAYLRLLGNDGKEVAWDNRGHFFAAAAQAMRRILVERARRRARIRHGGDLARVPLDDVPLDTNKDADELLALDEALGRLADTDPMAARLVELRYFTGLTMEEAAEALEISPRKAFYVWQYARAWLVREVRGSE